MRLRQFVASALYESVGLRVSDGHLRFSILRFSISGPFVAAVVIGNVGVLERTWVPRQV